MKKNEFLIIKKMFELNTVQVRYDSKDIGSITYDDINDNKIVIEFINKKFNPFIVTIDKLKLSKFDFSTLKEIYYNEVREMFYELYEYEEYLSE